MHTVKIVTRRGLIADSRLDEFVELVCKGGVVGGRMVDDKLPRAELIAYVEHRRRMIAVCAIKRAPRFQYLAKLKAGSGYEIPEGTQELGYVSVLESFRGQRLGNLVVREILDAYSSNALFGVLRLFGTTSNEAMKRIFIANGFLQVGRKWGEETLWLNQNIGG